MDEVSPRRGERMARWVIARLADGGVAVEPFKGADGWGLKFPGRERHTPEQRELAVDAIMFGIGYPRNFATMCRLIRERDRNRG